MDIVSNGSVAGTTITLTCTVSLPQPLREVPSIVWIAPDGTEIGNGTILDVETCSLTPYIETLTFSPLHTDYGGEYTCSAGVNIEEAGVSIANSSSVTITVQS